MRPLIQDLLFSLRSLRRTPGFTLVAVFTLTLGIAGSNVIFSVINATLLRTLPYPDSRSLTILQWRDQGDISALAYFMVKDQAHSFSSVAALYPVEVGVNLSAIGQPRYVKSLSVSKDFFATLAIQPEIGSTFSAEQDQPNAPRTAVLSYRLWTQNFNRQPEAVGSDLRINGEIYKVIGIMPTRFRSYPDADIWLPLQLHPGNADPGSNYRVIARLAPGISRQRAQSELDKIVREYQLAYMPSARKRALVLQGMQSFLVAGEQQGLAILCGAVALVFLIACVNVAVLILVRGAASTPAIAVRAALGPPKGRLLFSLMAESFVLAAVAGVLGLIAAKESLPLLLSFWPADLPLTRGWNIDWHVALFTFAVSILSPMIFGLAPALKLSRLNLAQVLALTSRTASPGMEQVRMVRLLVTGQMVLAMVLLTGTMLLGKSLVNLYSVPLGFDPQRLFVAQVSLAGERYRQTAATDRLVDQVVKDLQSLPGVDSVSAVDGLPLQNGLNIPLHPVEMPRAVEHAVEYRPITDDYFRTLRISLKSGRCFVTADTPGSAPVAIMNETLARRWWPDTPAVGHFIQVDEELGPQVADLPRQVVGVVADVHERRPGAPPPPTIFVPISQIPGKISAFFNKSFLTSFVVRASRPIDLSGQFNKAIQSVDPGLPLASFLPFSQIIDQSLANQRFVVLLTVVFGTFALLLAAVGIQGLLNFQSRLRTREIAIRIAVGASRVHIVRAVVRQAAKLISFALLLGLAGSLAVPRLLGSLLYNVQSTSLVLILSTCVVLGLIAALISFLTAIRAASIDPVAVLRNE